MAQGKKSVASVACMVAAGVLFALPALSGGATEEGKLRSFDAAPRADSATPRTEPPLHGTNPHGQGTAAVIDLDPDPKRPYSGDPSGGSDGEDVVIGRARGEQRPDGTYHGHITIAALFGNEILGVDTNPGESESGPLDSVQQALLTPLCNATAQQICLSAVTADSTTTSTGSTNRFSAANATIAGPVGLDVGALESNGNISSDGNCQTSHGDSQVLDATAVGVSVGVAKSSTDTRACRGEAPTQTNSSSVVDVSLLSTLPIPSQGCADGTPDSETGIPLLVPIVCNADDTNGTQADAPYGVRNALDVYVLATGPTALAKLSTASSESLAAAPAADTPPPTTTTPPPTTTTPPPTTTTPPPTTTTPPPTATTPTPDGDDGDGGDGDGGGDDGGDDGAGDGGGDDADDGGGAAPECSDTLDNDGDGVIDSRDPGCHSDGNANNPASYDPGDDSEFNGNPSASAGKLPFTGTDVLGVGLGGSLLLAAGLAIRGRARRHQLRS